MFEDTVTEVMDLDDDSLTSRFRELELQRRRTEAEMAAIVREGERRCINAADGHRTIRHWVRAQVNCSAADASRLRRLAVALDTVPGVGDALIDGHIGVGQASELARLRAHPRVSDQLADVAPLLLRHAEHLSFEEFRVVTRRWETLADLDGAARDDEVSRERRTATVLATGDGIDVRATGGSGLQAAEMTAIFARFVEAEFALDVAARTAAFGPDAPASALPRTDAQRRFDALSSIFRAAAIAPSDGRAPLPLVNLLVGLQTFERLVTRAATGADMGVNTDVDLNVERMESDTGVVVSERDILAATLMGHVRRVVVDSAGVVVDAGRKRRLFTGPARSMALLLAHSCQHVGCTVPADRCDVDHLAEWERDDGGTDQSNGRPRCSSHNPWKTANGIRSKRDLHGSVVDVRPDGSVMTPVGRRLDLAPEPSDDPANGWADRIVRVEYCRLHDAAAVRLALPDG